MQLKRYGLAEVTADLNARITQVQKEVAEFEAKTAANTKDEKARKKEISKRQKDIEALTEQKERAANLFEQIGGVITDEEARRLILQRHHDLVKDSLLRYMNTENRTLLEALHNLSDKYVTSVAAIEDEREQLTANLNNFFRQLEYLT